MSERRNVVIIGAGVIGMTTAHVLSTRFPGRFNITLVARDMPEDLTSQGFSSPWAGANWSPFGYDEKSYKRELLTFNKFWDMTSAGIVHVVPFRIYSGDVPQDIGSTLYFKDLVRNLKFIPDDQLPEGLKAGVVFDTIIVNPEEYLPWLKAQLTDFGVVFKRQKLNTLYDAAEIVGTSGILINATGLGARSLIGVEDKDVHPIRGQTILVHAPGVEECKECIAVQFYNIDTEDFTYMIPRLTPNEHILLGGTYQKNNWDTSVNFETAQEIWDRCTRFMPALKSDKARVVAHNTGLRPARTGGPRIELESVAFPLSRKFMHGATAGQGQQVLPVVHAYGFGGAGYQGSWGAAEEVADLVETLLQ